MIQHSELINPAILCFNSHFSMLFDTSPPVLATLNESLRNDPGVIR